MNIKQRLKKLEGQVQKASVRFVIRTWKDRDEARDTIARELGYRDYRHVLSSSLEDWVRLLRLYERLREQSALIETREFHERRGQTYRENARRGIRLVYCLWKKALGGNSGEEECKKRAYLVVKSRPLLGARTIYDTSEEHAKAAYEKIPEAREMLRWKERIEADYSSEERERWEKETV